MAKAHASLTNPVAGARSVSFHAQTIECSSHAACYHMQRHEKEWIQFAPYDRGIFSNVMAFILCTRDKVVERGAHDAV